MNETSRYHGLPIRHHVGKDGEASSYLARRFIPLTADAPVAGRHRVQPTDAIDYIAYRAYDDPTQFWRLADHAGVFDPLSLLLVGNDIEVPRPGPSRGVFTSDGDET